ncbi:MAG TPA: DUF6279 family lipoprotein [Pseudomonadales bacterium]|nr:DUF6279 family lipoprotein [Pseudomonadales bacterium]
MLLSSGCAVHWVYNQLDWLIPWYARDYLDLNSEQKTWLKTRVGAHLDWHRRTQLPQYAALLREMAVLVENNSLSEADVVRISNQINSLSEQIVTAAAPDLIQLFKGSDDKQLAKLFDKIEKDNKDFKKTYVDVTPDKQNELELEQMRGFLKKWLGGLSSEQKALLEKWAQEWKPLKADLYAEQLRWQADFRTCLSQRKSPEFDACMTKILLGGEAFYSDTYRQKYQYNVQLTNLLWLDVNRSLNAKQRKHAVQQLRDIADECTQLAAEAKSQ